MAIPGKTTEREPVGKIRVGEKRGKYAASLDYFRSDNPLFAEICPGDPSRIQINFYRRDDEAWNSGLEWWAQKDGKSTLACYTKDGGSDPVAKRLPQYMDPENELVHGRKLDATRHQIHCPFRECRHFIDKQCRPTGRMTFWLSGDPEQRPWRLDTKAWNSIEAIEQALAEHPKLHAWDLVVSFQSKGNKRFPVITLEPPVNVKNDADIAEADRIIALTKAVETNKTREGLADYLDATHPGWRARKDFVDRIREVTPEVAAKTIIERAHS